MLNYKIILVNNDLKNALLNSQEGSGSTKKEKTLDLKVYNKLTVEQNYINEWVASQVDLNLFQIDYNEFNLNPKDYISGISWFLGEEFQVKKKV
jgi:hypothetical protein